MHKTINNIGGCMTTLLECTTCGNGYTVTTTKPFTCHCGCTDFDVLLEPKLDDNPLDDVDAKSESEGYYLEVNSVLDIEPLGNI